MSTEVHERLTPAPGRRPSSRRPGKTPGGEKPRRGGRQYKGLLFTLPFLLGFMATYVIPIGYAAYQSLFQQKASALGFGPTRTVYSGAANFTSVFDDASFWSSLARVILLGAVQIPVMLGISLFMALLLDSAAARAVRFFRAGLLIPYVVPTVVSTLVWLFLYSPTGSPLHDVLQRVGADFDFFGGLTTYLSLGNVLTWQSIGFNMLLISAALQSLPREMYEAARLDGASEWRIAWSVKVPNITGILILTGMFSVIARLQLFGEPLILRQIAPESINTDFSPMLTIYYKAFQTGDYNYAAAQSLILALVTGVIAFFYFRFTNRRAS
ncbi:sugar ABC transporter permease [Streptomyces phaeochromogenes]|uniref:carbohydrate ABC transporter permease n=1 Tax=Streptomyces phaeochromogenes TaxID=1923 RepID=UPI002DD7B613|nr:sugar ABC transporter permease [Streptomyces phaeochromogenes]WRZ34674.1 sugar ABC transporter permease [Streptomyces phaeochromogenes]